MKIFFTTLFLFISFSIFAQEVTKDTKAKPEPVAPSSTAQEQQQAPGVVNDFEIGDYDKNGKYIFFDRLEREQKEAADEAAEQDQ